MIIEDSRKRDREIRMERLEIDGDGEIDGEIKTAVCRAMSVHNV